MAVPKPYRRTCRPGPDGKYPGDTRQTYIDDFGFAIAPEQYVNAFKLIQKDLLELFDYVEPVDENNKCYSYRIHELHMRTCIEVEANCKAILTENNYSKAAGYWNMTDYKKLDPTHRLSSYEVKLPRWHGTNNVRRPFSPWGPYGELSWYQAYNAAKHNRYNEFKKANFENLVETVAGLVALLSSQFYTHDFSMVTRFYDDRDIRDNFLPAIGDCFFVKFPDNWPQADWYSFDWEQLKKSDPDPFLCLQFKPALKKRAARR
jgi:hypothetical protein